MQYLLKAKADISVPAYDDSTGAEVLEEQSILELAVTSQMIFKNRRDVVNEHRLFFASAKTLDTNVEEFRSHLTI